MDKVLGKDAEEHSKDIPLEVFAGTLHKLRMLEADDFHSLIKKVA